MKIYLLVVELIVLKLCSASESCIPKPFDDKEFWKILQYREKTQSLFVNFSSLDASVRDCMDKSNLRYKFELVTRYDNKTDWACNRLAAHMDIERKAIYFNNSISGKAFQHVQGQYFLRLKECTPYSCRSGNEECSSLDKDRCVCSSTEKYGDTQSTQCLKLKSKPTEKIEATSIEHQTHLCKSSGSEVCHFSFEAKVPMCVKIHHYSQVEAILVKKPIGMEGNSITFKELSSAVQSKIIPIKPHKSSNNIGLVRYDNVEVKANASYILVIHLLTPHCYRRNSKNCYFVLKAAPCYPHLCSIPPDRWKLPIIIGVISGLVFALSLIVAIVVRCKKPHRYQRSDSLLPNESPPQPSNPNKKQEIVLVHFPDTEIFRKLNTEFRDWLSSLSTVKEVIDVNDDNYSEGRDGIIRNPEGWVANTLGDEEKRIILVTSQLAYECLTNLRQGNPPPMFPEPNPLDDLLVHMLRFLDSEMFVGNYSRLSCVRYSQITVCNGFGARAVNIVPGTEYLLPDHLDELSGWISSNPLKTESLAKRQNFIAAIEDLKQSENRNICVYTKI